ncbi:peptidase S41 [Rhodanobacter thiooxydans]|uniref:Peptidase S41 n=1 Tax=Rhodanobacter thiooxydans TaxID=416169 RepID=A0A154QGK8_9GAMM|nr:S41 family peptidase [Rhodanobacter thiooxydans]EIM02703.1 C-terminal processing peptidase [Rhodanobacter thiooxydans LCS2]KZC23296.1 peptidase S41 [Rhodanobacter thiooxydans]MCW0203870.1 S41 family peptidase [Rhodanobacter thiooxydans]
MRLSPSGAPLGLTALLLVAPFLLAAPSLCAQNPPASPAAPVELPAATSSAAVPATAGSVDQVDLDDIRNFSRVYEVVRQAYVEKVDDKTLMKAAITGMLSGLDPHSEYLDKEGLTQLNEDTTGQYSGLGIEVLQVDGGLRIVSPIDDTPAARAGIKPGDSIVKINGIVVDAQNVDGMFKELRGKPGSKVDLTIVHQNSDKLIDLHLVRENIAISSVKVRELEPGYAYVRISQFQDDTAGDLERKLGQLIAKNGAPKGAVLDLRNNPGGLLTAAVGVSDDFLDAGTIVTTRGRLQDANMSFKAHPGDQLAGAPMVVLTNNGTASAAEIVSGALKDNHRALIMGQRTFGKGVVQTVLPLDADHAVKITTARYYTPNGTSIQAEGIKPDIALAELTVNPSDHGPVLISSEADLPNHLANEKAQAGTDINDDGSAADAKLATSDYALSQALNVLKGMALRQPAAVRR